MTRAQRRNWYKFCSEQLYKIERYEEALADGFKGWCIHHRREIQPDGTRVSRQELKDHGLYFGRPASELIFMRVPEHHSLHSAGEGNALFGKSMPEEVKNKISKTRLQRIANGEIKMDISYLHTPEVRAKISIAAKKRLADKKNHPMYGKRQSEESRHKNSLSQRGKHWWNDGVSCKRAKECPGPEWKPGRILKPWEMVYASGG